MVIIKVLLSCSLSLSLPPLPLPPHSYSYFFLLLLPSHKCAMLWTLHDQSLPRSPIEDEGDQNIGKNLPGMAGPWRHSVTSTGDNTDILPEHRVLRTLRASKRFSAGCVSYRWVRTHVLWQYLACVREFIYSGVKWKQRFILTLSSANESGMRTQQGDNSTTAMHTRQMAEKVTFVSKGSQGEAPKSSWIGASIVGQLFLWELTLAAGCVLWW